MQRSRAPFIVCLAVLALTSGASVRAGTPAQECAAAKLKAAGKKASDGLNCHREAAKRGLAVDGACVTRTTDKLTAAFAKVEAKSGCAVMGDASDMDARVSTWTNQVATLLRPISDASDCAAKKLRATGRKSRSKAACWAAAVKRGEAVDPACLTRAEQKFSDRFAAAEAGGSCLTTGDAVAVEESVDRFADDLRVAERTGCVAGTVAPGDSVRTLTSGGIVRTYRLHVPPGYAAGQPAALVLNFHGGTSSATAQATVSQMHPKSDAAGFLVIEPEGYGGPFNIPTWNAGNCCGPAMTAGIDDVAFTDAMIDHLAADACVDEKRVFATGYSNGAMLSHRVACQLSDRIAAIAPNAGGIGDVNQNGMPPVQVYTCAPTRPVPVFAMHGLADTCYDFNGGVGTGFSGTNFISIPTTIAGWVARNGCSMTTVTSYQNGNATCATYQGCAQGADVTLCTVAGMGHAWPGSPTYNLAATCGGTASQDLEGTEALWDFFVAHPMP